jgi:hypothetical protein
MNYLQQSMLALAKTEDTEMIRLFQRFSARLSAFLTPTELDTYARYLLAPTSRAPGAPATFAEQAVRTKVQADPVASALGKQIVAGLAQRKRALQSGIEQDREKPAQPHSKE